METVKSAAVKIATVPINTALHAVPQSVKNTVAAAHHQALAATDMPHLGLSSKSNGHSILAGLSAPKTTNPATCEQPLMAPNVKSTFSSIEPGEVFTTTTPKALPIEPQPASAPPVSNPPVKKSFTEKAYKLGMSVVHGFKAAAASVFGALTGLFSALKGDKVKVYMAPNVGPMFEPYPIKKTGMFAHLGAKVTGLFQ